MSIHAGRELTLRLDKADVLADYLGLELVEGNERQSDRLDAGKVKGEIMGTVFKEDRNQAAAGRGEDHRPQGATACRVERRQGKTPDGTVTAAEDRIDRVYTARTYTAKYRDGSGIVREVATGCRDESAARSILTELERRAEQVKGEILTAAEAA